MTPILAVLCDSPTQAVAYAVHRSAGMSPEMAIDAVGRQSGKQVCGPYRGRAVIVEERTEARDGTLFRVTAWRFERDRQVAWQAEATFAAGDRSEGGRA